MQLLHCSERENERENCNATEARISFPDPPVCPEGTQGEGNRDRREFPVNSKREKRAGKVDREITSDDLLPIAVTAFAVALISACKHFGWLQ